MVNRIFERASNSLSQAHFFTNSPASSSFIAFYSLLNNVRMFYQFIKMEILLGFHLINQSCGGVYNIYIKIYISFLRTHCVLVH